VRRSTNLTLPERQYLLRHSRTAGALSAGYPGVLVLQVAPEYPALHVHAPFSAEQVPLPLHDVAAKQYVPQVGP
jgi:hypothetical protein